MHFLIESYGFYSVKWIKQETKGLLMTPEPIHSTFFKLVQTYVEHDIKTKCKTSAKFILHYTWTNDGIFVIQLHPRSSATFEKIQPNSRVKQCIQINTDFQGTTKKPRTLVQIMEETISLKKQQPLWSTQAHTHLPYAAYCCGEAPMLMTLKPFENLILSQLCIWIKF